MRRKKKCRSLSPKQKRKAELVKKVKMMKQNEMSISKIFRETGLAKKTIRKYTKLDVEIASTYQLSRPRPNKLNPYKSLIEELVYSGKNAVQIHSVLKERESLFSYSSVKTFVRKFKTSLPKSQKPSRIIKKVPRKRIWISRFSLVRNLWSYKENLTKKQKCNLKKTLDKYTFLEPIYQLVQSFRKLMKERDIVALVEWISKATMSGIKEIISFAKGLNDDWHEVSNAFVYSYSNGLLEGQINRLKTIKRQLYGRAKIDLLAKKVLYQF